MALKFSGLLTVNIFEISSNDELWLNEHKTGRMVIDHRGKEYEKRSLLINGGPSGSHRVGLHIQSPDGEESPRMDTDFNALV